MSKHFTLFTWALIALVLGSGIAVKAETESEVEETTESPIADMALVDSAMMPMSSVEENMDGKQQAMPDSAQPQTIADFIIHPLIALKPRVPEEPMGDGKQASNSSTPSTWQLFGFNTGQGLGSSVSSLAGTVTGWLGNRIQLPSLIETPVGESTTTTTTTTTTPRPDVVVRVQHRPTTTRKPLIQINQSQNRPHRFSDNNLYDSEEYDDDEYDDDDFDNRDNGEYDDDDDYDTEEDDHLDEEVDDDEEEEDNAPVRRRRPNQRSDNRNKNKNNKRVQQDSEEEEEADDEVDDGDVDADGDAEDDDADDDDIDDDQDFYYNNRNNNNHASTKRSQNQQGFIQLSQQSLLNQIRQLTRGQTPAELGATMRKSSQAAGTTNKRRPQATLVINRNGQTVYLAPELIEASQAGNKLQQYPVFAAANVQSNKRPVVGFPQPPLTVPVRRKGKPTQYITIPWSQLGISPPNSQLVSVTEGIQSQPLILNIPQSALDAMQNTKTVRRKPVVTADALPLLAEASIMDVFKPPQIPPARTPSANKVQKKKNSQNSMSPVIIATKTKQRIRAGTIVEKAPDMDNMNSDTSADNGSENQFIVVGDDVEPGLGRQVFPVVGEARQYHHFNPYFNLFQNRQFNARKGRQVQEASPEPEVPATESTTEKLVMEAEVKPTESPVPVMEPAKEAHVVQSVVEQQIPVQVVTSESEIAKVSTTVAKPEETKTE